VSQFSIDQLGSMGSTVLSSNVGRAARWCPASYDVSMSMHESYPYIPSLSWLGVSTSSLREITSMPADGLLPTVLDLNWTRVCGESSSEHSKTPWAMDKANLPAASTCLGKCNPEGEQRGMARSSFSVYLTCLKCRHCAIARRTVLTRTRAMS
jgi:hypothetical protein